MALTGQGEATTRSQPPPTDQVHPGTAGEQSRSSPERASHDSDKVTPLASASTQSTSCHIKTPCPLAGHSPWIKPHMLPSQNSGQQRREQAAQVSVQKNPPPKALETWSPQQFGAELTLKPLTLPTVVAGRSGFHSQKSSVLSCSSSTWNTQISTVNPITMATHHFCGSFGTLSSRASQRQDHTSHM